ncbi:translocation protein sec63 [Pisolithus orientalis]|uniref:translocation protein sec63 n=1 Tax=Pisolithus orientalis TaxID=936130 RepID=UPI002224F412|nr:translocation protein sec63 [Pisolithus orientalis]KAI6003519.1 translocation protein sec63 [Pisolithus orientalis]
MANYHYDEAGNMAAYFLISVLAIILVPVTLSTVTRFAAGHPKDPKGCQCKLCVERRRQILARTKGSPLKMILTKRMFSVLLGWSLVAFLAYKVANAQDENKVYNPFDILGIAAGTSEKEIKSHFKKLSKLYHPDKVKATLNQTIDEIEKRFVDITKAYKALTDETIRRNYELYGHPDGRQELSMGIAIPSWIVEGKNNVWVLGIYGILVGGVLPGMVGKWWFGNRGRTKEGVSAKTAEGFWKGLAETSGITEVGKVFVNAFQHERVTKVGGDLRKVEGEIEKRLGKDWSELKSSPADEASTRALVLLYAHFLRLELGSKALLEEQKSLLLQTPLLLNAYLSIASARSWLSPTLAVMRLHAYIAQAIVPGRRSLQAQLPGFAPDAPADEVDDLSDVVRQLRESGDERAEEAQKAFTGLGSLEIVDMRFKVIGERVVTPSSIVFLLVKLRLKDLSTLPIDGTKSEVAEPEDSPSNNEIDEKFLHSRRDAEEIEVGDTGVAHAPYWPGLRKPGWWLILADDKSNRIVVPPLKIMDVPLSDPSKERNYRCYKLQFQAPPNVGLFTWKVYFVSDTFIGGESCRDIVLKIDDVSALNAEEQHLEDEISDPEEDTLAGQMAAMRGGPVKKVPVAEEDSDDSLTDDGDEDDSSDSD